MRFEKLFVFILAIFVLAGFGSTAADPVTQDPADIDPEYPPTMLELGLVSHGARLSGFMYLANGPGPHPAVLLLHGFPGNEKNLDLAQDLRRAGYNVMFFHYRGAWGSEGEFSIMNGREDVLAALAFMRDHAADFRTDPSRITLIGHSLGGYFALYGGARDAQVRCTVAIAPADVAALGRRFRAQAQEGTLPESFPAPGPPAQSYVMLRHYDFAGLVAETMQKAETLDLAAIASGYRGKALFMISGSRDTVVPPAMQHGLMDIFSGVEGLALEEHILPADHSFSAHRIALSRSILDWLQGNGC